MKIYTIIAGVNGVGKSSFFGVLCGIRYDLGSLINESQINSSIEKGINFTQETTLSGSKTLRTIKQAREHDYYIRLYYIGVNSAQESIKRISNRVEKGGHDIPTEDVLRRYNKRFDNLIAVLPYCNEVKLYDNENGFVEKAEYKNGMLIIKGNNITDWLKELQNKLDN